MKKIYLAKSNRCNPDTLFKVREELKKYDCIVMEYNGGAYTDVDMLSCDMLLILTEKFNHDVTIVGKGLYNQIVTFNDKMNGLIFVLPHISDKPLLKIERLSLRKMNDFVEYADVVISEMKNCNLSSILDIKTHTYKIEYVLSENKPMLASCKKFNISLA